MKTINKILNKHGLSIEGIDFYVKKGICNGCGAKNGFNFSKKLESIPYFRKSKRAQLLKDLRIICNIHDINFFVGHHFKDFIKANYELGIDIMDLLYWTKTYKRLFIFFIVFISTTLFGWKAFKDKTF